jgi:flagellar FliJ protein
MKRFTFNLEKVLRLRMHQEHEAEVALGEITSRCVSINREIRARREEKRRVMGGRRFSALGMAGYAAAEAYTRRLDHEMGELRNQLAECEKEREEAQRRFMEASRRRKVLDKLKEKKQERHRHEARREEQRELDEIGAEILARHRQ